MSDHPTGSDWIAARGQKWSTQLAGMEATLMPVDEPLLRALKLETPSRIAEVGCGGGGTAIELLRRAPAGSVIHGFDISPSLIEVARGRQRPGERAVAFEVADMATAAPERPYDRLVSRFGVMFFDEPQAAFANLVRWLEPGGRFAFAVWGRCGRQPLDDQRARRGGPDRRAAANRSGGAGAFSVRGPRRIARLARAGRLLRPRGG